MKKIIPIPKFEDENAEAEYWHNLDLSEYLEPSDFKPISFSNLKPTAHSQDLHKKSP